MRTAAATLMLCLLAIGAFGDPESQPETSASEETMTDQATTDSTPSAETVEILVIYDNRTVDTSLESAWGFACLIDLPGTRLLFDTGGDEAILMSNMRKLNIDPKSIDIAVLSHAHWDHVGGLAGFLKAAAGPIVYMLASFPDDVIAAAKYPGVDMIGLKGDRAVCTGCFATGEMGSSIKEQALVIATGEGTIVITGCAHPGIVEMVKKAKDMVDDSVLFVMGGFHLLRHSAEEINGIIDQFKDMGVKYAGPCHCSGDETIALFEKAYGDHFIEIGAGRKITLDDLP